MTEIHDLIGASRRKVVANGGITSIGIGVRRAWVLGKLTCGVPVLRLGGEATFDGLNYVTFPGNVGRPDALTEPVKLLRRAALSQTTVPQALTTPPSNETTREMPRTDCKPERLAARCLYKHH